MKKILDTVKYVFNELINQKETELRGRGLIK